MKKGFLRVIGASLCAIFLFASGLQVLSAQTINLNAQSLLPRAEVFFSPRTGTFLEGSTFEIPIFINTRGNNINTIELSIGFDQNKLRVINPSGGRSIIGIWVEPPFYDNSRGLIRLVGVIPNGIKTDSGLIATVTFKAVATGETSLTIKNDSNILLNDGL